MFSFRRKPRKQPDTPNIRTSLSLPELSSQGIPWPENLVDVAVIQQAQSDHPPQGAAKVSFQGVHHPVSFHKPFRDFPGTLKDGGTISSLYMSSQPTPFDGRKSTPTTAGRYVQRRARVPPTFNLMVVGGKGTGKTSLLRLLLETADISPSATIDQRTAFNRFLRGPTKATQAIQTACLEICESKFDRVLFSVIDTPGLDFLEGRELKLERQVNAIIKFVDAQYADTMSEESKVVRKSRGDQHIHLCIYTIDPMSIMTVAARHALSSLPSNTRSETTVSHPSPPDLVPDTSSGDDSDDEEATLTMSPAEIRVIRRLSTRCNVLPVVSHADSLTDEKLQAVKRAIRTSMAQAGLDFGVFEPAKIPEPIPTTETRVTFHNGSGTSAEDDDGTAHDDQELSEGREARPVVKLRSPRRSNGGGRSHSRSRSRRDLGGTEDYLPPSSPEAADPESLANIRFSAHIIAKTDMNRLLPFALIAPEGSRRRERPSSSDSKLFTTSPIQSPGDAVPQTPASIHSSRVPYRYSPPEDLRGAFTRNFRWGVVDVLDPNHCDFAALRTAILSTHLNLLKTHTKEVLYEKYRTEKLLARRATRNISDDDRQRLLEGESPQLPSL